MKKIFVTGIGTDVGKTVVSAILTKALNADYWKPIQAGDLDNSDTNRVEKLVNNSSSIFHSETYLFTEAMSPHAAADIDNVKIDLTEIKLPSTDKNLIVEGAGGLLVPLSNDLLIADLITHLGLGVVVVSRNYLGSINHTLLTISELMTRNIPIIGIVFNGVRNDATEGLILNQTKIPLLFRINEEKEITSSIIEIYSDSIKRKLNNFFDK